MRPNEMRLLLTASVETLCWSITLKAGLYFTRRLKTSAETLHGNIDFILWLDNF